MNELRHYGVKGMKWGKRKKIDPSSAQKSAQDKALDTYSSTREAKSNTKLKVNSVDHETFLRGPGQATRTYIIGGRTYQTTADGAKKIQEEYNKAKNFGSGGGGAAKTDEDFEDAVRKKAEEQKKKKKALDFLSKSKKLKSVTKSSTTSVKDKVTSFLKSLGEKPKKKKKKKAKISVETKLMHYGVKGMKWGVRKAKPTPGNRRGRTNAQRIYESATRKKETSKISSKPAKRRVSDMSDEELRSAINRMQMERTYAQLTAKEVSKGRKFVNEVLYNSAKNTATKVTTEAMQNAVKRLLRNSNNSGGGS